MKTQQKDRNPEFNAEAVAKEWLKIKEPTDREAELIANLAHLLEGVFAEGVHTGLIQKSLILCMN